MQRNIAGTKKSIDKSTVKGKVGICKSVNSEKSMLNPQLLPISSKERDTVVVQVPILSLRNTNQLNHVRASVSVMLSKNDCLSKNGYDIYVILTIA
jgi:hypothetical protein